ncbi:Cna B-type domain-containing protein, partial [Clostridium sp. 1001271B_151109_B4]|uniref:Cna B-type domain-containing protein n=1 Tax=Clostridium sp. 1001271B_151109_B4 TaxID=2787148 RepID=UPI0018AA4DA4
MRRKIRKGLVFIIGMLMILSTLTNELSVYVQATINNSQVLVEGEENDTSVINVNNEEALLKESGITVYNDKNNNGWYYIIENGVKKTVYCYQHDKTQPSIYGTSGYSKINFFSSNVATPASPATKEMIATLLYLGFPSNATELQEKWRVDDSRANYLTQQTVWDLARGDVITYLKDQAYDYDLHYYSGSPDSPYYGKYGYSGNINLSGDTIFQRIGDTYKTGVINIEGDYTGSFSFDSLPSGIKIYNASTSQEVTGALTVGMQIYFTYDGTTTLGSQIDLKYKYDTTEVFYLKASNSSNQDLVGLDVKNNEGVLTLTAKEDKKVSYTVVKKWNDSSNKDNLRPNSIEVQLKADDKAYGNVVVLNENNNWTYTWQGIPEKSSQGTIKYSVEEIGNLANYNVTYEEKNQTTVITNTETMDIPVTKKWVGDAAQSATIR